MNLSGRIAVVTGAGSGIGRAVSVLLAKRGCQLALVDIDPESLDGTAALIEAEGADARCFVVDVSNREQMQALPGRVVEAFGAVHILVNNAGVSVGATFAEQTVEDLEWIIGINLWGVVYGCKFFLPVLREQDEAHIVNISSMFGFLGLPGHASYCVTKAGVKALSEALWSELADTSVNVTSVHPGGIATNIAKAARTVDDEVREHGRDLMARYGHSPAKAARKIVGAIQANRKRVLIGPEAYITDWLKRALPVTFHRILTMFHLRSPAAAREKARASR
ncbi:MAG: NAD(P)-dependent dehydrogenase (short-subunit alcohol dehydrogenase family) [Hyphomicrobiaceae bacterium]|jgi:NAD(P)-dependent dehydrogenase (short-subunit alcohol dehydrogenase family)